jgi:Holliday junction resolvasome RuvABC endonuclease subunit
MRILALDLATKTGWCFAEAGKPVSVGTLQLPRTGNNIGVFLSTFSAWLRPALLERQPDLVVFESPILRGATQIATLRKLYGLAGVTEMIADEYGARVFECSITQAKKALSGNGRAEKPDMIEAAKGRGVEVTDDNQADAFGVFLFAVAQASPSNLSAYDPVFAGVLA